MSSMDNYAEGTFLREKAKMVIIEKLATKGPVSQNMKDIINALDISILEHTKRFAENERKCLNTFIDARFKAHYIQTWRRIYLNLIAPNNDLDKRLFEHGTVNVAQLPQMTHRELNPHIDAEYYLEQQRRDQLKQQSMEPTLVDLADVVEGQMKCMKCLHKNGPRYAYSLEIRSLQTRSADEPETQFVYCKNCGNRWKM